MKVSVITVCFNAQDTIEETIQSVLNQTYKDIEYIIVDGKSTDNTVSIIQRYREKISCFISEKDNGIYDAMNKGISLITGEIVFFLNSGDLFFNEKVIENIVNYFKANDVDLVYGDVVILDPVELLPRIQVHQGIDRLYFFENNICHQGIFAKTEVFRKYGGFDTSFRITADYEWLLRVLFRYKVRSLYINQIVSVFALGGLSSDPINFKTYLCERKKIKKNYYGFLEYFLFENKIFSKLINFSLRKIYIRMSYLFKNKG